MPWFTDTTNAPKIIDETSPQKELYSFAWPPWPTYHRVITTQQYRFCHLTMAAADSIAAAKTVGDVTASSVRENDAGAYQVRVTSKTIGAWETGA